MADWTALELFDELDLADGESVVEVIDAEGVAHRAFVVDSDDGVFRIRLVEEDGS